jgi:hypothetical protein
MKRVLGRPPVGEVQFGQRHSQLKHLIPPSRLIVACATIAPPGDCLDGCSNVLHTARMRA